MGKVGIRRGMQEVPSSRMHGEVAGHGQEIDALCLEDIGWRAERVSEVVASVEEA